jgi:hypothetical protein
VRSLCSFRFTLRLRMCCFSESLISLCSLVMRLGTRYLSFALCRMTSGSVIVRLVRPGFSPWTGLIFQKSLNGSVVVGSQVNSVPGLLDV